MVDSDFNAPLNFNAGNAPQNNQNKWKSAVVKSAMNNPKAEKLKMPQEVATSCLVDIQYAMNSYFFLASTMRRNGQENNDIDLLLKSAQMTNTAAKLVEAYMRVIDTKLGESIVFPSE